MNYPGGKNAAGIYQRIINQMPPHSTYIEPFFGSGAVMRYKRAARVNIGIDRDLAVVESIVGPRVTAETQASAGAALEHCEPVGFLSARVSTGMPTPDPPFPPGMILIWGDGIEYLSSYPWVGDELVYCDPPYLRLGRRRQIYRQDLEPGDHERLLDVLLNLPCPVILSGYPSKLYSDRLHNWRVLTYTAMTRGGKATEVLWMNYPEPIALHDYRYIGNNRRERENFKRLQMRWSRRFSQMPSVKRYAILSALEDFIET